MQQRRNIVKISAITGCVLGLILMAFVVLAPNIRVGKTRMIIPESMIPKAPDGMKPGAPAPLDVKIKRLVIGAVFMGPFGLMAGTGVGLLLQGLINLFRKDKKEPIA